MRIPDITDCWRQREETHSKYAELFNVSRDIFSTIPHAVRVKARFSLGRDDIGCSQSRTTAVTLRKEVVARQFAQPNTGIFAGDDPALDTSNARNYCEMKQEAEEWKLRRMLKVHDLLEIWQGSHNLCATQKESRAWNKLMTSIGYISDTEEIMKTSFLLFQPDGVAAFKLSETPSSPPAGSAMDLPGWQTRILNVHWIGRINRHPVESDDDSSTECILHTENWLNCSGALDNPNDSKDDCSAAVESDMEQDNGIEDPECTEQRDVNAVPNVPGLIYPTWESKRKAEKVSMTVNAIEMRRNEGTKTTYDRMRQCFTSCVM